VRGVRQQILHYLSKNEKEPGFWEANNTLFVTWVGVNDCGSVSEAQIEHNIKELFTYQERLYAVGARNFLFIDVPPIHLSPAVADHRREEASRLYSTWNFSFCRQIEAFCAAHGDLTALLFSSYRLFMSLLENPNTHGFEAQDVHKMGGDIWADHLHPTSKVHDIVASGIADFLTRVDKK